MADVMVVSIFMGYLGLNGVVDNELENMSSKGELINIITTNGTHLESGFYSFLSFVIISFIISLMIKNSRLESSNRADIILDNEETILEHSDEASKLFKGLKQDMPLSYIVDIEHELVSFRHFVSLAKTNPRLEHVLHTHKGYFKITYEKISRTKYMIVFVDITEQKEKQELIKQNERLDAIANIIQSYSHQLKKPLKEISNQLQIFDSTDSLDSHQKGELSKLSAKHMENIYSIIKEFTGFFSKNDTNTEFNVQDSINDSLLILSYTLEKESISLDVNSEGEFALFGKKSYFEEVIVHIVKNAIEVMVERDITDKKISLKYGTNEHTNYIQISDNGGGIPEDILPNIFDLDVSTKGDSTGFGLHMCKLVIENQMNGYLTAHLTENGSMFKIEFSSHVDFFN